MVRTASIAALLLVAGCVSQHEANFSQVKPGMTKEQVRALLGPPSSTFERRRDGEITIVERERWQYGDNLSTLATGALFPEAAPSRVWVVTFTDEGLVESVRSPTALDARGLQTQHDER